MTNKKERINIAKQFVIELKQLMEKYEIVSIVNSSDDFYSDFYLSVNGKQTAYFENMWSIDSYTCEEMLEKLEKEK